jgi:hypothetical protein
LLRRKDKLEENMIDPIRSELFELLGSKIIENLTGPRWFGLP